MFSKSDISHYRFIDSIGKMKNFIIIFGFKFNLYNSTYCLFDEKLDPGTKALSESFKNLSQDQLKNYLRREKYLKFKD